MLDLPIYEKEGLVLLVQTDHLTGETIGTAIDDLYRAGAHNVQVIASITKKNRPGQLFMIDTSQAHLAAIEQTILLELGATGWHLLRSAHRHTGTQILTQQVVFDTPDGAVTMTVKLKSVKARANMLRPEHASCLEIRQALRQRGVILSLDQVRQQILTQVLADNFASAEASEGTP